MDIKRQKELLISNLLMAAASADKHNTDVKIRPEAVFAMLIPMLNELEPVVHCINCKHRKASIYSGYYYCDAWDHDINMLSINPEKYFCAEGETT